jgi:lauroyl/myristoyl acyltransferase
MIASAALDIACRLASALPPGARGRLAAGLAGLQYRADRVRREAALGNLSALALAGRPDLADPRARERAARSMFASYHLFLMEYLAQRRVLPSALRSGLRLRGMEILYRALSEGRGAVTSVPHLGNWEIAGLALAKLGFPIHVVTGIQLHPRLSPGARAMKEAARIRVSTGADGPGGLLETLRSGGLVILLVDGDVFTGSLPTRFFGRTVPFPTGPAVLARRTGAPIVHAHAERLGPDRFLVSFDGVDRADPSLPLAEDVRRLTSRTAEAQERNIAARVDQWCIFRPLFETIDAA